jgi:aspartate/methionine/tyrosine aminotransferase
MIFNLGFGNSVAVRKAFLDNFSQGMIVFTHDKLMNFNYTEYEGDEELLKYTKSIVKRQTGHDYEYFVLTVGATGAINLALSVYKDNGEDFCLTRKPPYYLRYPNMIEAAGMEHLTEDDKIPTETVSLIDIPSNPLNLITDSKHIAMTAIIDGVYLNRVYTRKQTQLPYHDLMIGSYSKLTGLNGMRVGWIGTNNLNTYLLLKDQAMSVYCGMSAAESHMLNNMFYNFDWEHFETKARCYLDYNREELQKLERFTEGSVQEDGMFWYCPMDSKFQDILTKSNVIWTKGSLTGTSDDFGRLNVGADCNTVREAVSTILKMDRL